MIFYVGNVEQICELIFIRDCLVTRKPKKIAPIPKINLARYTTAQPKQEQDVTSAPISAISPSPFIKPEPGTTPDSSTPSASESIQDDVSPKSKKGKKKKEKPDPLAKYSAPVVEINGQQFVRGLPYTPDKPPLYNQLWTPEEVERLRELLHVFPDESPSTLRWRKIAEALGRRTPRQVASKTQKLFIKMAKDGLDVPGRVPNLEAHLKKTVKKRGRPRTKQEKVRDEDSYYHPPPVNMSDEDDIDDMHDTEEYKELMELYRQKRARETNVGAARFRCDGCGVDPIVGKRYHCEECQEVDLCSTCAVESTIGSHLPSHPMSESIAPDLDYVTSATADQQPDYLDPTFMSN
eukprot:TRINITY_DN5751_c0_g1_i1.p1 TRINITY_DN5751_c0_g1~~TRINITY_DN5751_c0_g1_i1.p1  ORF type:complete len:350 (-),score=93.51 TRINITY_DN5751_c0_g1_i1:22-1071(-)